MEDRVSKPLDTFNVIDLTRCCSRRLAGLFPSVHMIKIHSNRHRYSAHRPRSQRRSRGLGAPEQRRDIEESVPTPWDTLIALLLTRRCSRCLAGLFPPFS